MKKLNFVSLVIILAFAFVTFSVAWAGWANPGCAPTGCNADAPINVSPAEQIKAGSLQIGQHLTVRGRVLIGNLTSLKGVLIGYDGNDIQGRSGANLASNSNLILNRYGGSVGVGTATPNSGLKLHVAGNVGADKYCDQTGQNCLVPGGSTTTGTGTNYWTLSGTNIFNNNAGNVGIGTNAPSDKLTVNGHIKALSSNGSVAVWHGSSGGVVGTESATPLYLQSNKVNLVTLSPSKNVGIGTTAPNTAYRMDVSGKVIADDFCLRDGVTCLKSLANRVTALENKVFNGDTTIINPPPPPPPPSTTKTYSTSASVPPNGPGTTMQIDCMDVSSGAYPKAKTLTAVGCLGYTSQNNKLGTYGWAVGCNIPHREQDCCQSSAGSGDAWCGALRPFVTMGTPLRQCLEAKTTMSVECSN